MPDGNVVFMAEGAANNVGTVVEWGKRVGRDNYVLQSWTALEILTL